jgi:hypothetical protein
MSVESFVIECVVCLETYRTPDQTYTADDYFVDGIKLLRLPLQFTPTEDADATESTTDMVRRYLEQFSTDFIKQIRLALKSTDPQARAMLEQTFPRALKIMDTDTPHWYHVTTDAALSKRPNEFHGNGFSEAELLGVAESDSESETAQVPETIAEAVSVYLNSDGDVIEAPPDKFLSAMLD